MSGDINTGPGPTKLTRSTAVWLVVYLVCVVIIVSVMWRARARSLQQDGTPVAQDDWAQWRAEAERQAAGDGPVLRRPPKSSEPPGLVLLRDHFWTSLLGILLLSTAIYFTLMLMIRGVLAGPQFQVGDAEQESAE